MPVRCRISEGFWAGAAAGIDWVRPWTQVLDRSAAPFYRWFSGGELNTCFNAVDSHVADGRGAQAAIIYDSPVTDTRRVITYAELQDLVARFGGVLRGLGVAKGDRVIIYMPMVPEAPRRLGQFELALGEDAVELHRLETVPPARPAVEDRHALVADPIELPLAHRATRHGGGNPTDSPIGVRGSGCFLTAESASG